MRFPSPLLAVALLASGCAAGTADSSAGRTDVVVAAYPLEYLAQRVGGERVVVRNVATPGVEPHDLELSPQDVRAVAQADLVATLPSLSPALDDAVRQNGVALHDVSAGIRTLPAPAHDDHEDEPGNEPREEHGEETETEDAADPHFWLDPLRFADAADQLAERLSELDPAGAAGYRSRATALRADLHRLDRDYAAALANCRTRDLVTAHDAFSYLASRYGLVQRPIGGLSPDIEPSAAALAAITEYVREHGVTTIYAEVLTDPAVARTVAAETGATVAVLDPIEGRPQAASAADYLQLMRANLETLRTGQACR